MANYRESNDFPIDEEEDIEDTSAFYDSLVGEMEKLPSLFQISENLMAQFLQYYFYDVTEIGRCFATENGRESILSELSIPNFAHETLRFCSSDQLTSQKQCPLCNQLFDGRDMMCLICGHFFCTKCWIQHIRSGHIDCLDSSCHCRIPYRDVKAFCPDIDIDRFYECQTKILHEQAKLRLLAQNLAMFNCPECLNEMDIDDSIFGNLCCNTCKKMFCMKCHKLAHNPLTCEQYAEFSLLRSKYLKSYKDLARYKTYQDNKSQLKQRKQKFANLINFAINYDNKQEFCENITMNLESNLINFDNVIKIYNVTSEDNCDCDAVINDKTFSDQYNDVIPYFKNTYMRMINDEKELNQSISDISEQVASFEQDAYLQKFMDGLEIITDELNRIPEIIDFDYGSSEEFDGDFAVADTPHIPFEQADCPDEDHLLTISENAANELHEEQLPSCAETNDDESMKATLNQYFDMLKIIEQNPEFSTLFTYPMMDMRIKERQRKISIQFHMAKILKAYHDAFFHYNKNHPNHDQLIQNYKNIIRLLFEHSIDREIEMPYYVIKLYYYLFQL